MKQVTGRMWLALLTVVAVYGTAAPASAALTMTQIDMNDTYVGGWTTSPNPGIFHLFVIQGNNPQGAIVNSGTDQPINIPLADGTYEFTLLGNDNAGSESTLSSPGPTLSFTNGSATTTLRVSTVSPSGTTTLGGSTIRVSNFTFTPWQQSGINRVTNHFVGALGPEGAYNDAVAHFTIEISSLPAGVVSWWRAEGNFNDSVDGNTGFPVNTVNFVSGRTGQAFSFNGSAMRVPSSANLNFGTGNFSGSMWVKTTVGGGFMVEKDIPGTNGSDWFVHLVGGKVRFVVGQGGDPSVTSSVQVDDGNFHHVAWVRNGTSLSVYIDGVLSGQANASFVGNVSNGVQFVIGAEINNESNNNLINTSVSVIDEVAIFNRALSAAEILSISGDLQPPVISLNGSNPMILECPAAYFEPGASVSDTFDPAPSLSISGTVDSHTPGTYTVTYTSTDAKGNTTSITRTVNVVDTQRPTVTLAGPATMTIECHASFTDPGATALDACDGDLTASIVTTGSVDANTVGSYTLSYTATDHSGNSNSTIRTVNVVDTTAPVVTAALTAISRDRDEDEDGNFYLIGATATDACDAHPAVSALITQPLTSSTSMTVSYKKEKHNRIQLQVEKKKLVVKLEGPSESALRALWTQVLAAGGFSVSDGQQLQLVLKKDKGEYEAQYRFDRELKLTSAKGPGLKLVVVATDASGNSATATVVPARLGDDDDRRLSKRIAGVQPGSFALNQNYPNPFNPSTTISYDLVEATAVRLTIYNVMGQEVRELVAGAQEAGSYEVQWDGRDGRGQLVASGFYLYRLQAGDQVAVQKMLFAK